MGEELTDREIHKACQRTSLGCPNCGGQLILTGSSDFSPEEKIIVLRLMATQKLGLIPIEDAPEIIKTEDPLPGIREFTQ